MVMKTNSLITYWSDLFIHLLAPKRAVGLSADQGSQCFLTPKTVQSTSLSFQSVYYVQVCNGLTLGVLGVGHVIADNVLKVYVDLLIPSAMIVMKTSSLITYWSELFTHLLAPKRAVGLSAD